MFSSVSCRHRSVVPVVISIPILALSVVAAAGDDQRIRPYAENPYFWQYKGEPVLLIGGSDHDNLFNHPEVGPDGLESHLDLLVACGGNYVRNTMSSRDEGNPWAFARDDATGRYDLRHMGDEFWRRFEDFLNWTAQRDIIVQIEVFDRFDYAREPWQRNPFNPKNNVNYTTAESGLPESINSHPGQRENPFFRSVPELDNNRVILPFQQAFVDTMLSYSLRHGHVLYCISNETNEDAAWGAYWARYIRDAAQKAGVEVHVTEMWDPWDLSHPMHRRTFDHPELYTFIDISQNNHQTGQAHWDNAQQQRRRIADAPRPINNVKMYGGTAHGGGYEEGLRKLWRNVLGGMASARYHRPGEWTKDGPLHGAGLSPEAQAYLRGVRTVMDVLRWPAIEPDLDFVSLAAEPDVTVQTRRTHVVYVRDADGEARFYIDGVEAAATQVAGDVSPWDSSLRLALANELTGARPWLGTYHLVAIYDRSLDAEEIKTHFRAGTSKSLAGLQVRYSFDERQGTVVRDGSGLTPPLNLHIQEPEAVTWRTDGLEVKSRTIISTREPAERLTESIKRSNAITVEAWITPAQQSQSGPARIVTLSANHDVRNFTLAQSDNAYEMRLRTTRTTANAVPGLTTGSDRQASIAAARSIAGDRVAIFVSHGGLLDVDMSRLRPGLTTRWFNPRANTWHDVAARDDGFFQPPSTDDWVLVLQ
jgi:hypothetical protein